MSLGTPAISDINTLASLAALGDRDALGSLYEDHADKLRRWLETRTYGDSYTADDIAQETWIKVARNISKFDPQRGSFQQWLWGVARNELREHYGRPKRETLTAEMLMFDHTTNHDSPEGQNERQAAAAMIAAEVQSLPAAQRTCLIHRFYTGLSLAETGDLMGKSANTIKQLQYRACRQLSKRLGADMLEMFASTFSGDTYAAFPANATAGGTR